MKWWPFGRRAEKRAIRYQDVWGAGHDIDALDGPMGDKIHVALSMVPVYAATRLIADSVSSLPLQSYRHVGDTHTPIPAPSLLRDPTQFGTVYDWVHRAVVSLALRGNAFGLVTVVDSNGAPSQIEWLNPDEVHLTHDDIAYVPNWYWRGRPIDPAQFVHIPGYTLPGRVLGLSPIGAYKTTIETGIQAANFGRDWFANGSTPAAVLETADEVTEEQAKGIKDRFKQAAKGREPVALGIGVTYKPISVPAEESQFIATAKMGATQVASIYAIPPELIGGETGRSMTYHTVEQQQIMLVSHALRPYMVKFETAISGLMPRPQYVRFNVDELLRADTAVRYQAHHLALTDGWKSKDEIRAEENLAPIPNGEGQGFAAIPPPSPVGASAFQPEGGLPK